MSSRCNVSTNYTPEEIQEYLAALQHESTLDFIPALVFLSLLIVVGIAGNTLVLVVYKTKMTRTLRVLIIHLAFFDLLADILVIPGEIYDMFHVWNFKLPTVCKIRRFYSATFIISSALVLVAIATASSVQAASPVSVQAASPDSVQAASPDSVQAASPDSVQAASPDSVQAASPDSVDALKGTSLAVYQLLLLSYTSFRTLATFGD
ncbi:uncharacterized protein LOC106067079 isoform X3 [Biomphalaria glabrata]|uniref:Uncharacterized protein LOC106067079 isoform X3 n=1 Tax=Biomphalaria glabrata TaxID=6526 RepID=A0A9W3BE61_BIOGL|nr:uncharacterized protein LOC106067079 isoform X3 [Biomphalaria glabrata]XP_055897716.1 uncharacterized protein LOC106067079 isoform X3 [Biomphalaria glabrata]